MPLRTFTEYNKNLYQEQKEFTSTELEELLFKSVPVLRKLLANPNATIVAISTHANQAMTSFLTLTSPRKDDAILSKKESPPSPPSQSFAARKSRMTFAEISSMAVKLSPTGLTPPPPDIALSSATPTSEPDILSSQPSVSADPSPSLPSPSPRYYSSPHNHPSYPDRPLYSKSPRPLYSGPVVYLRRDDSTSPASRPLTRNKSIVPHIVFEDDDDDYDAILADEYSKQSFLKRVSMSQTFGDYSPTFAKSALATIPGTPRASLLSENQLYPANNSPSRGLSRSSGASFGGLNLGNTPESISPLGRTSSAYFGNLMSPAPAQLSTPSPGPRSILSKPSSAAFSPLTYSTPSDGTISITPTMNRRSSAKFGNKLSTHNANMFGRMQSSHRQIGGSKSTYSYGGRSGVSKQASSHQPFGRTLSTMKSGASLSSFNRMTPAASRLQAHASQAAIKQKGFYDSSSDMFDGIDEEEYLADNTYSECLIRERKRMRELDKFVHQRKLQFSVSKHIPVKLCLAMLAVASQRLCDNMVS